MNASEELICSVHLEDHHRATGNTVHLVNGEELAKPAELRIVQYEGDTGYYLFYCDEEGHEMTDTYHDTVESAVEQAEFEFGVKDTEWHKA